MNRAGIAVLDAVERVLFIEHREHAIAVIKVLQVVDQLRLRARGIVCSLDTNGGSRNQLF
jgi:hypothetical protein